MKTIITILIILILLLSGYFWFTSSSISPQYYKPATVKAFSIPVITLSKLDTLGPLPGIGPEDITIDEEGNLYTGLTNGKIIKIDPATKKQEMIAQVPGRPLGIHIWQHTKLLVCVVGHGIYQVDLLGKEAHPLIANRFGFEEEIVPSNSGKIYFSDGSKYNILIPRQQLYEALEHKAYGRVWMFDPISKQLQLIKDNIYFANGLALNADQTFLVVGDMFNLRLLKYDLKTKATSIFIDGLAGYPDNIALGSDNLFWTAIYSPPIKLLDTLASQPFIRKIIAQLPLFLLPRPEKNSWVIAINQNGVIVKAFKIKGLNITSVIENKGILYLGTLNKPFIYVINLKQFRT